MNRRNVCLVGFGYWGPNLARNVVASNSFDLCFIFEPDKSKHPKIAQLYPAVIILVSKDELVKHQEEIEVALIATPTSSHYELAKQFLNLGCHIWVEKPFTNNLIEARTLLSIAKAKGLKIFVDHTYLYTSSVSEIKRRLPEIGSITYINSNRANFGIIQNDSSVIWDLAVHDLSIINYLVEKAPISVIATATTPFLGIQFSVATILLNYSDFLCTIHINWLSPFKVRDFTLGGTSKSIHFDDTKTEDKVKIYSQSIEDLPNYTKKDIRLYNYKYGDILIPDISNEEALGVALSEFADYINGGNEPPSSGDRAFDVITILAAAEISIQRSGELVSLQSLQEEENE